MFNKPYQFANAVSFSLIELKNISKIEKTEASVEPFSVNNAKKQQFSETIISKNEENTFEQVEGFLRVLVQQSEGLHKGIRYTLIFSVAMFFNALLFFIVKFFVDYSQKLSKEFNYKVELHKKKKKEKIAREFPIKSMREFDI